MEEFKRPRAIQRDPELAGGSVLAAHELEIVAVELEVAREVAALDGLRKCFEPLDLRVREKPGRHPGQ